MLYVGNSKIIKGYIGNTPIAYAGFGKSDLIKIEGGSGGEEQKPFYIEYTVDNIYKTYPLNGGTYTTTKYGLPRIYSDNSNYTFDGYEDIEITLLDGSTTTDVTTTCDQVAKVKLWFLETTAAVKFDGYSTSSPVIKTMLYCNTSNLIDMSYMFSSCSKIETINLSNWEVNYTVSCNSTFTTCTEVTEIFLPKKFSPINILAMFQNCNSLIEIHGLERIEHLTSGSNRRTFENCYSLKKVSMPYLDASLATRLDTMFLNCTSLEEIDFSHIKINDSCIVTTFLNNCTSLKSIQISADSLPVIQSIVQQLPATNGSFTVIGAENIMPKLKELLKNTNWNIICNGCNCKIT